LQANANWDPIPIAADLDLGRRGARFVACRVEELRVVVGRVIRNTIRNPALVRAVTATDGAEARDEIVRIAGRFAVRDAAAEKVLSGAPKARRATAPCGPGGKQPFIFENLV
jgi:hypothetical protein